MNWGKGIAIFFSLFVLSILGMVYKASHYRPDMVAKNYYDYDIKYQSHIDKMKNNQSLEEDVKISVADGQFSIHFPEKLTNPTGEITFFRPSDGSKDFKLQIDNQKNIQIPMDEHPKGLWKVQIDWQSEGKNYYKEQNIQI